MQVGSGTFTDKFDAQVMPFYALGRSYVLAPVPQVATYLVKVSDSINLLIKLYILSKI